MSTPTQIPVGQPTEAVQPGLSESQRIINTFVAPSKTFLDIRRNANWWVPWLLSTLAIMAFFYTVEKKVGYEAIVTNRMAHASFMQKMTAQLPPEKKQEMIDKQVQSSHRQMYTAPIFTLIGSAIFAALLLGTFNFLFAAEVTYKQSLAILFYGTLPKILSAALAILVMFIGVEPDGFDVESPVATNLGALLGSNTDSRALYHLLGGIDLFSVWWVALVGIGFAVVSKKKISTSTAIGAVAAWYVVGILLRVAMVPFAG
ncbi:MAG TPA: YIP1 family protein [Candidatus Angelobacter sp.]|nr:YIP1 family protein [Candidatus Angelobacter sp.]